MKRNVLYCVLLTITLFLAIRFVDRLAEKKPNVDAFEKPSGQQYMLGGQHFGEFPVNWI